MLNSPPNIKGGLDTITTPPSVTMVAKNIKIPPKGSPRNKLAKMLTNTG
jgi:hypothetical protein